MYRKALVIMLVVLFAVALAAQVKFNPQQQKQHAQCTTAAAKVQAETRALLTLARGPEFSAAKLKAQVPRLQQAYTAMHEQHKALVEPMESELSKPLAEHKELMDQQCIKIRASLKALELAAAAPAPDKKKVASQAGVIELALKEWQKHHEVMGRELGAK